MSLTASLVAVGIHGDAVTDIADVRVVVGDLETESQRQKVSERKGHVIKKDDERQTVSSASSAQINVKCTQSTECLLEGAVLQQWE